MLEHVPSMHKALWSITTTTETRYTTATKTRMTVHICKSQHWGGEAEVLRVQDHLLATLELEAIMGCMIVYLKKIFFLANLLFHFKATDQLESMM